jgi:hypothetical protein
VNQALFPVRVVLAAGPETILPRLTAITICEIIYVVSKKMHEMRSGKMQRLSWTREQGGTMGQACLSAEHFHA